MQMSEFRNLLAGDDFAATFQEIDEYRAVLLRLLDGVRTHADARPVAWMDDGSTRNGSESTSYRVVTDETKRMRDWIEEAVDYVNSPTMSPSLEREGRAILNRPSAATVAEPTIKEPLNVGQQAEPGADERAAQSVNELPRVVNSLGGFRGGFIAVHGRAPTEQEIWNGAVRSGLDRAAQSGQRAGVAPEYVMVQRRMRPTWRPEGEGWTDWEECSEATARDCEQVPILHGWQHEVRWLCVAAAPTQQQEGQHG